MNLYDILFFIFSSIRIPFIKTLSKISSDLMQKELLEHGDMVFSRRDWYLKNLIVPGRYKHVGAWDAERGKVLEMQDDGYEETDLEDFVKRYTEVAIGQVPNTKRKDFIEKFRTYSDREYDNKFVTNTKAMYCSEACYHAADGFNGQYKIEKIFWKKVITPHGLFKLIKIKAIVKV